MDAEAQGILLEIPEQPAAAPVRKVEGVVPAAKPKLKPIDREQGLLRPVIVDELVAEAGFEKVGMRGDRWGIFTVSVARRGLGNEKPGIRNQKEI